jgi:SAM-dependent methyltransferase
VPYDPTIYEGCARNYAEARPPYSRELGPTLASELRLDDRGRLLDVGCGPGTLAIELADLFEETVALDPDAEMLAEGARRAGDRRIRWVRALAEDIPGLGLGGFRLATFGQSFYWTDRERVAEAIYDLLEPGGAIAVIVHVWQGHPAPPGPAHPPIPHDEIHALVDRYLGARRRAGRGFRDAPTDSSADALARTRFGRPRTVFAPGRADVVQDADTVLASFLSMSFAAPRLFGDRLSDFAADVRELLAARSPTGRFRTWAGDTEILLAVRPRS